MKYYLIMSDVWRAVITVGQWQHVWTRRLLEGALVFLRSRLIRTGFAIRLSLWVRVLHCIGA